MLEKTIFTRHRWVLIFSLGFAGAGLASDPVIYFTYNFNFNLNFAECPVDSTPVMVEQGHIPLLDLFDKHKKWKADFFFTGYTSDYLQNKYPDLVRRIKKGLGKGKYHISTYTFTHPVLSLIPYDDVVRQLRTGLEYDRKVWGIRPKGLFLPEVSWDVCLPQIMNDVGIEWVSIYKEIVPAYTDELVYPSTAYVEGINQTKAKVVLCTHSMDQGSTEALRQRLDSLYAVLKERGINEFLVAFKDDAECLYFKSLEDNPGYYLRFLQRLFGAFGVPSLEYGGNGTIQPIISTTRKTGAPCCSRSSACCRRTVLLLSVHPNINAGSLGSMSPSHQIRPTQGATGHGPGLTTTAFWPARQITVLMSGMISRETRLT